MMGGVIERCGNCAFYMDHNRESECHKHAPIVLSGVVGYDFKGEVDGIQTMEKIFGAKTHWPVVRITDFCGEWELSDVRP